MPFLFPFVLHFVLVLFAAAQGLKGDSKCGTTLCVSATVNSSLTTYALSPRGNGRVGWLAIGFGTQMTNVPIVIAWMNSDGTATISQRRASGYVMPAVDPNPARSATLSQEFSILQADAPTFAFTMPSPTETTERIVYAYGTTNPGSSAEDARIIQHADTGLLELDLSKDIATPTSPGTPSTPASSGIIRPTPTGNDDANQSINFPLLPYQKVIIAHAVFCALGFLLFLPAGALLARYARTFLAGPVWFKGHWIFQLVIAGPTIFIGIILGIVAVGQANAPHLDTTHKRFGIVLFVFYIVQTVFGYVIHKLKKPNRVRRPFQNYGHAIFGLLIIALSLYQVRLGYDTEWPVTTGRDPVPEGVNIFFWVWLVILAVAYAAGLAFLPKQYRQESKAAGQSRYQSFDDDRNRYHLKETSYRR